MVSVIFCGGVSKDRAAKIFGNMSYHIEKSLAEKNITLINGEYEKWPNNIYYGDKYVYGDFNHDGLRDAAVIIIKNTGGGGNQSWFALAFLINNGGKLVHQATINLDDRAEIYSMCEKNGKVLIDMNVHQPGDCNGGPSKHLREWYAYPGPNVFTMRAGTYISGEHAKGIKGMPDKDHQSLLSFPPGYNQGFVGRMVAEK